MATKKELEKAWRKANPERVKATRKAWTKANLEKKRATDKAWAKANPEKTKAAVKAWQKSNPEKLRANTAKRKALKLQRTPAWLTDIDKERIQNEYKLAVLQTKLTGESWHVDHIIPLQGKLVSGLHVPSNLRATRGKDNLSKSNNFEVI
jgi:hypothetical protein